jgi:hypothetical protein
MRALLWCLTALLPALTQADILEFIFKGEFSASGNPDGLFEPVQSP